MSANLDLFQPFEVPDSLKPFIRRAVYVCCDKKIDTVFNPGPTGYPFLIWVCRGELIQEAGGEQHCGAGELFLPGQIKDFEITVRYSGRVVTLMIEFTALGCYQLFGVRGCDTLNSAPRLSAQSAIGADFSSDLTKLSGALKEDDINGRFKVLFSALEDISHQARVLPDYLSLALQEMETRDGAVKVAELCERTGISRRQFTRKFTEIVGVPPKYFCRVIQMNKAMEALVSENKALLSEIANNAGYFDEAHLINTVQAFFGLPAKTVTEEEHPAVVKMHSSSRKV